MLSGTNHSLTHEESTSFSLAIFEWPDIHPLVWKKLLTLSRTSTFSWAFKSRRCCFIGTRRISGRGSGRIWTPFYLLGLFIIQQLYLMRLHTQLSQTLVCGKWWKSLQTLHSTDHVSLTVLMEGTSPRLSEFILAWLTAPATCLCVHAYTLDTRSSQTGLSGCRQNSEPAAILLGLHSLGSGIRSGQTRSLNVQKIRSDENVSQFEIDGLQWAGQLGPRYESNVPNIQPSWFVRESL